MPMKKREGRKNSGVQLLAVCEQYVTPVPAYLDPHETNSVPFT
jgi:hypothetical protein